jgi:four helix bundle protein
MDDKDKLKKEFKIRLYRYILCLLKFLTQLPNGPVIREIKSQTTRSGTSIGANYFEAGGASSKKDYRNYFNIALKSANETVFWLAVLRDSELAPLSLKEECESLLRETKEIACIFASSIITMKRKR